MQHPLATLLAFVTSSPILKKEDICIFSKALQVPHTLCGPVSIARRRKYTCVLVLLHNKKSQTPSKQTGLKHYATALATLLAFVTSSPILKNEDTCIFSKALQVPHALCGLVSIACRRKYTCVLFLLHSKKSQTPSKQTGLLHYIQFSINTEIVVPTPTLLSIESRSPCFATMCFTIASPRPVPPVSLERLLSTR